MCSSDLAEEAGAGLAVSYLLTVWWMYYNATFALSRKRSLLYFGEPFLLAHLLQSGCHLTGLQNCLPLIACACALAGTTKDTSDGEFWKLYYGIVIAMLVFNEPLSTTATLVGCLSIIIILERWSEGNRIKEGTKN